MSRKIPMHFNNEDLNELNELIDLLGLGGTYGEIPKAVKFSITLAINTIKTAPKVIPMLDLAKVDLMLSSIRKIKIEEIKKKASDSLI